MAAFENGVGESFTAEPTLLKCVKKGGLILLTSETVRRSFPYLGDHFQKQDVSKKRF